MIQSAHGLIAQLTIVLRLHPEGKKGADPGLFFFWGGGGAQKHYVGEETSRVRSSLKLLITIMELIDVETYFSFC